MRGAGLSRRSAARGRLLTPGRRIRRSRGDLGLQRLWQTDAGVAARMVMLDILQAGGSVLGQAMEQVTGGNLPSMLLIACAFTLSLVYLLRLAVGHLAPPLPAGAVRAPLGVLLGGRCDQGDRRASEGLAPRCRRAVAVARAVATARTLLSSVLGALTSVARPGLVGVVFAAAVLSVTALLTGALPVALRARVGLAAVPLSVR